MKFSVDYFKSVGGFVAADARYFKRIFLIPCVDGLHLRQKRDGVVIGNVHVDKSVFVLRRDLYARHGNVRVNARRFPHGEQRDQKHNRYYHYKRDYFLFHINPPPLPCQSGL